LNKTKDEYQKKKNSTIYDEDDWRVESVFHWKHTKLIGAVTIYLLLFGTRPFELLQSEKFSTRNYVTGLLMSIIMVLVLIVLFNFLINLYQNK
jgi:hypothetical protein